MELLSSTSIPDCAVCLQTCHHPTLLPCGHIFCFLCVKGVALQNKKCAMCRAEIPSNYLDSPKLLEKLRPELRTTETAQLNYQWYYEGRNGWWKYDERSNAELENAYSEGSTTCSLLLAGALYIIDFQTMIQFRRNDPTRRRSVRRDTPGLPAKGVAGIMDLENKEVNQILTSKNRNHLASSSDNDDDVILAEDTQSTSTAEIVDLTDENDDIINRLSAISLEQPEQTQNDNI